MASVHSAKAAAPSSVRKLTCSALFVALALVLPFLTGQIPEIGNMLCPMHIPVLLCGFICGWPWGLAVGFISPLLRCAIFGMPLILPALAMAFEMAVYGMVCGLLYHILPKKKWSIYASLLCAMVLGRVAWGCVQMVITGLRQTEFSMAMFLSGAVLSAIPGIILQILLIPLIVMALERAGLILNR